MASDFRLKEQLPELTKRIVQTYTDVPTINHLGHCPLPNYEVVISAIEDLEAKSFIPVIAAARDCTWGT